jgi:hypothetical protein
MRVFGNPIDQRAWRQPPHPRPLSQGWERGACEWGRRLQVLIRKDIGEPVIMVTRANEKITLKEFCPLKAPL